MVNSYSSPIVFDTILVRGNMAMGAIDIKNSYYIFLNKEKGLWKLNLSMQMAVVDVSLQKFIQEAGYTEEEFMELTAKEMNAALKKGNNYTPLAKRK